MTPQQLSQHFKLIPIEAHGKRPTVEAWQEGDYTDEALLSLLMDANYGAVVGPKHLIIDCDPRNGGTESYKKLIADYPELAALAPTVSTVSGGVHFYTALPEGFEGSLRKKVSSYPGIDWLYRNMYAVAPGSVNGSGGWDWHDKAVWPPQQFPIGTLDKLFPAAEAPAEDTPADIVTPEELEQLLATIDVTDYREHEEWLALMMSSSYICPTGESVFAAWSASDVAYKDHHSLTEYRYGTLSADRRNPVTGRTLLKALPSPKPPWLLSRLGIEEQARVEFTPLKAPAKERDYVTELEAAKVNLIGRPLDDALMALWSEAAADSTLPAPIRGKFRSLVAKTIGCKVGDLDSTTALPASEAPIPMDQPLSLAADRVVAKFNGHLLHHGGVAYTYKKRKGCWEKTHPEAIAHYAQNTIDDMMDEFTARGIVVGGTHASSTAKLIATRTFKDDPSLFAPERTRPQINTLGGVLKLNEAGNWSLHKHQPNQYFDYVCPVKYNADEPFGCPTWDKFVYDMADGDEQMIKTLHVLPIYAMISKVPWRRKAFFLHGETATGKGVYSDVLTRMLGDDNTSAVALDQFGTRFALQGMIGKLANIAGEISGKRSSSAMFKAICAGDLVQVDVKNKQPVQVRSRAVLIFSGNQFPSLPDETDAVEDRICLLPCTNVVPESERITDLADKLMMEQEAILNKCLEVFSVEYLADECLGAFMLSEPGAKQMADWKLESKPIEAYWQERVVTTGSDSDRISYADLYQDYRRWAGSTGHSLPTTQNKFIRLIRRNKSLKVAKSGGVRKLCGIIFNDNFAPIEDKWPWE